MLRADPTAPTETCKGKEEAERDVAGTLGFGTLYRKTPVHRAYRRAQGKSDTHLGFLKTENLVLLFLIHRDSCQGNAYHFTGAFFPRKERFAQ